MKTSTLFQLFVLITTIHLGSVSAIKRLHFGPPAGHTNKIIRAHTLTDPILSTPQTQFSFQSPSRVSRHLVDIDLHVKRDIVLWTELEEDGVKLRSGRVSSSNRKSSFVLTGGNIDISDFKVGAIFIIEIEDWEQQTKTPFPDFRGIDADDPVLFFRIDSATVSGASTVHIESIVVPGDDVVPEIDISVHEEPADSAVLPKKFVFDDEPLFAQPVVGLRPTNRDRLNRSDDTLSVVSRPSFSKNINLFSGVSLSISAGITPKVKKIRMTRLRGLHFQWDQSLDAFFSATLKVTTFSSKSHRTGEIARVGIPKLSFSISFPVIGKFSAGGFVGINWISELEVSRKVTIKFTVKYARKERVNVQLSPPKYSAKNLLPAGSGGSGGLSAHFTSATSSTKFGGFFGLRPVVGVGISYKRKKLTWTGFKTIHKSIEGNLGANVGVEVITTWKNPPFKPYTGGGIKLGTCNKCHALQGQVSLRGKKLSLQRVKNGKVEYEKVLVHNLFKVPLGTLCVLKKMCAVRPVGPGQFVDLPRRSHSIA